MVGNWPDGYARLAMDYLMNLSPRPQIIVVEEAHAMDYNAYISELQARTGQSWNGVFQGHCASGGWNGSWCTASDDEGVGIFTSFPIVSSDRSYLASSADAYHSARALVRAAVNVNGVVVQVFGTHMQTDAYNEIQARYYSMQQFRSWATNFSTPQIVAGDFNADPDQIDSSSGMGGAFYDVGTGLSYPTPSPYSHLDYWFYDVSGKARVQSASVDTSPGTFSDHAPVKATFSLAP